MNLSNPTMNTQVFSHSRGSARDSDAMTINGAATKTLFLLFLLIIAAGWVWSQAFQPATYGSVATVSMGSISGYMMGGLIVGLVIAITLTFKPIWSPTLAPVYAIAEGLAIGGITVMAESRFPGLPMQAAGLTFAILAAMLLAYRSGMVQPTDRFKSILMAAGGGIFLVYMVSFVLSFFGTTIPFIHGSGPIGIGFSLLVVGVASFFLVLDFERIEEGARMGAPKYMEWYGAFGLLVTLIWLYIEILNLLMKLSSRDD